MLGKRVKGFETAGRGAAIDGHTTEDIKMNKIGKLGIFFFLSFVLLISAGANAEQLNITKSDSIETVLKRNTDKRVTVKLASGEELSGKVTAVTGKLLHLSELSGREFFDAAISMSEVSAVIVRVRDK